MFVESVVGVGTGRVRGGRKDVEVLHYGDDVWCVAAACAFSVVCVDCAVVDGRDGGLDEAGLVECIGVDEALDVVFIAGPV